ncbi:MAG TPA: hypothetical protein VIS96_12855 [Terrimicrobiaceae bacterium]
MRKIPSPNIRTLRRQVADLGATLYWQGSQWILSGRETEPLGHSIKTERDALEFVLDRARGRLMESVKKSGVKRPERETVDASRGGPPQNR